MGRPSHRNVVTCSGLGFPRTAKGNHPPWWITRGSSACYPTWCGAAALASAVGAFVLFGLEGGVKFILVALALAVPRLVGGIPAPFDVAYCATLLLATWSATAAWYQAVPWID